MPRLSLYKPTKTNDYYFMDRQIREQFWIGGTGVNVHKYIGPSVIPDQKDPSQPNYIDGREVDPFTGEFINTDGIINETKIQDLLFLENRDRKYDPDIYDLRGVYNVQDNDFDLTQFGMFLSNDQLYMTFHLNEMVDLIGRKLLAGDVLELPHIREEFSLDISKSPIPKYYVVTDGSRGAEGFSQTWYPHIWRVKLSPLTDSQEFYDILGDASDQNALNSTVSTYKSEFNINDAVVASAAQDDPDGTSLLDHLYGFDYPTAGGVVIQNNTYTHGEVISSGSEFPGNPQEGQYFIRNDFSPARMFVRRGSKWERRFDNIDELTWTDRTYNASDYINNENQNTIVNDEEFKEKQAISDVILPRPDNKLSPSYVASGYVNDGYVEE
jgi:hypothetical protein